MDKLLSRRYRIAMIQRNVKWFSNPMTFATLVKELPKEEAFAAKHQPTAAGPIFVCFGRV